MTEPCALIYPTSARLIFAGTRVGRSSLLPKVPDTFDIEMRTVKVMRLPANSTIDSVRTMFSVAGEVRTVRMPAAAAAASTFAEVEFVEAEAAFQACEKLTDNQNWRGGLRVVLSNDLSVAAGRRALIKASGKKSKDSQKKKKKNAAGDKETVAAFDGGGKGSAPGACTDEPTARAAEGAGEGKLRVGRQTGVVQLLKAPYGFFAPDPLPGVANRKLTREGNVYFPTSKDLPLRNGDAVTFDLIFNDRTGKPNAINIEVVPSAARDGKETTPIAQVAPAAEEPNVPMPASARPKLLAKQSRMAKGPDGTLGFHSPHRAPRARASGVDGGE